MEHLRRQRYGLGSAIPMPCFEPFSAAVLTSLASTAGTTAAAVGTEAIAASSALAPLTLTGVQSAVYGGGSLLSSLGSLSTVGSVLSGLATVGSIMNTQKAAEIKADSYDLHAGDAKLDAAIEENQSIEKRTSLKAALVKAVGERDVAAAASGVDLSFGTPAVARKEAVRDTEAAISASDSSAQTRRSRLLERAASYKQMAAQTRQGALAKEAGIGLNFAAGLFNRG